MKIRIDDDYGECNKEKSVVCNDQIITCDTYKVDNSQETEIRGSITVVSRLGNKNGVFIKSSKINLYMLNGISPKLVSSQYTNEKGEVTFKDLKKGSYRVIAIVDRKYFEKPIYVNWNEVNIDRNMQQESILVVNRVKQRKN